MGPSSPRPAVQPFSSAPSPEPQSHEIDGTKEILHNAIDMASRNSTKVWEIARRLGYREPPCDPKGPEVDPVPNGHIQEIHAKLDVLTLINSQTRELLQFVESQI